MHGFETVGNATLIVHDDQPLLATDPWLEGDAYFGSWGRTHEVPAEQRDAIRRCPYLWISHGHPDHLSLESLDPCREATILLSAHVGSRIARDLEDLGYRVRVLPTKEWVELSPRVRVQSIPDFNQDSILLVEMGDELLLDLNDASPRSWEPYVRKVATSGKYRQVWLLRINGYGDATMINYFDEEGQRVVPPQLGINRERGMGYRAEEVAERLGANIVVPFSFFHHYQREDSIWANEHVADVSEFERGYSGRYPLEFTKPFVRYDMEKRELTNLSPRPIGQKLYKPSDFGDEWSEELSAEDRKKVRDYFLARQKLADHFRFVNVRVGGKDLVIDFDPKKSWGVTLEAPRTSLMKTVEWEVFDDLFIGNFMKMTLHGNARLGDFKPVLLWADNGRAFTREQLESYFEHYRKIFPAGYLRFRLNEAVNDFARRYFPQESLRFRALKRAVRLVR